MPDYATAGIMFTQPQLSLQNDTRAVGSSPPHRNENTAQAYPLVGKMAANASAGTSNSFPDVVIST